MSKMKEVLGQTLRAARVAARLSQAALAQRSGIPKPTLSRYENGRVLPSMTTLRRLAIALEVPLSSLIASPDEGGVLLSRALQRRGIVVQTESDAERIADLVAGLEPPPHGGVVRHKGRHAYPSFQSSL